MYPVLVLVVLSATATLSRTAVHATDVDDATDERGVIKFAVEQLNLEIARDYLRDKKAPLPTTITSYPKLIVFLKRLYPDSDHELRRALSNLTEYGEAYVPAVPPLTARIYLQDGVKKYAVNLRGE